MWRGASASIVSASMGSGAAIVASFFVSVPRSQQHTRQSILLLARMSIASCVFKRLSPLLCHVEFCIHGVGALACHCTLPSPSTVTKFTHSGAKRSNRCGSIIGVACIKYLFKNRFRNLALAGHAAQLQR